MKRLLRKLFWFLLFLIPLLIILDLAFSSILKKSHAYSGEIEVWNDIYNGNIDATIAVYGSSRAWGQINPAILEDSLSKSVYNFGIDGHNFWLQYLRHKEYIKNNTSPKTIIISVDVFSLQKREDLYQMEQFLPFMLWNQEIKKFTSVYKGFSPYDYYVPLIRYSGQYSAFKNIAKGIFKTDTTRFRYHGFRAKDKMWNNDLENAIAKGIKYTIKIDSANYQLFKRFILECRKNNIELIMVYTPEYIEGQKFVSNRQTVINIYETLAAESGYKFYNFSNDPLCYDKKYFYNASHLNSSGVDIFTAKLASLLKQNQQNPEIRIPAIKGDSSIADS
jgi:hypothetical protein